MRPIDPRLLRYARSIRGFLVVTVLLGVVTALVVILQARVLSDVVVHVSEGAWRWSDAQSSVIVVLGLFAVRAIIVWLLDVSAVRASAGAKRDLRSAALGHVLALGPAARLEAGATATLVTRGIDALDGYFARYLPQLVLAIVVPIAVLVAIVTQDVLSAVIIAVTLPLIPLFMVLIGLYTRSRVDRQWRTLAVLSGHFLDLVTGLPTLKAFGRSRGQAAAVESVGDRYRSTTMGVLRVSFLSSLVLELLATLSVAVVAVSMGLRLDAGRVTFAVAFLVLLLAPEAYLPLRLVGQHFHAAAEGLGAADRVLSLLETPLPLTGLGREVPGPGPVTIHVDAPCVAYDGRAVLDGPRFTALPGTVTAVIGPSGCGKSTLLAVLLGFTAPDTGTIAVSDAHRTFALGELDPHAWRQRIAWLPQSPVLVSSTLEERATVRDVVRLARPRATDEEVRHALSRAGLNVDLDTRVAADGTRFSAGQHQRLALARVLLCRADVVLLDEPTAALDAETERVVAGAVREEADRGAVVIVVAHRPAVVRLSDQIVRLASSTPLPSATTDRDPVLLPGGGW